jgi:hypothetical protein
LRSDRKRKGGGSQLSPLGRLLPLTFRHPRQQAPTAPARNGTGGSNRFPPAASHVRTGSLPSSYRQKAEHAAHRPAFRTSPRCSHHRNMSPSAIRWPRFIPKRNAIHCSGGVLALRSVIPRCTSAPHRPRLRPPPESRRRYSRPRGHCPEIDLRPAYVRSVTCPYRCLSQVSDFEQCCRNDLSGL